MLFNSWIFIGFVIVTSIVYYMPFLRKWQVYVLILSSLVFYAYASPELLSLLLLSALINAVASYGAKYYLNYSKLFATVGVIVNVCLLAFFKYSNLISTSFLDISDGLGRFLCTLPLPLGISFFTFSGISLVVDAYKERIEYKESRISFATHIKDTLLYICFFPKLVSGPIAESKVFCVQINQKFFEKIDWYFVFKSLTVGYFLKMVIADNLKDFTSSISYPFFENLGSDQLLLLIYGYSFQMFADFAGYSLIAIGVAAIFGYRLPDNFNFPYLSSSFREFWKRWHITLSQFLMNYLYIPLGGGRKGKIRTYINLLLTMMLGGLWHGAAWSYLVWGTYHGLLLVVERALCGKRDYCITFGSNKKISHFLSVGLVFTMVSFGWLLFKLPDFSEAIYYIECLSRNFSKCGLMDFTVLICLCYYSIPVIIYHTLDYCKGSIFVQKCIQPYSHILYGVMLFLILTNSGSANTFVYFQF